MEVAGSVPTTGRKKKKEYLLLLNTCVRSCLTELEQFTPVVHIKGSVRDSGSTPEFGMKHLKKAVGHIVRNVVSITIKMRLIVRIF